MTSDGDARRARLGDAAVDAARTEARAAPAPGAALYDALSILFADLRRAPVPVRDPALDAANRRDDVA